MFFTRPRVRRLTLRALIVPATRLTTWVLLALIGLAVRTAFSPDERVPLANAMAEPRTVSARGELEVAAADVTASVGATVAADLPAVIESDDSSAGDVGASGNGAAAAPDSSALGDDTGTVGDEAGRLLRPEQPADAGAAGGKPGGESSKKRARQLRSCARDHTLRATLSNYCRVGTGDVDFCCANDDGFCSTYLGRRCDSYDDNDCRIFEVLLRTHEFLLSKKSLDRYTPDQRQSAFASKGEYFRLVPCMQAQGYLNLYSCTGEELFLQEALDRLDFIAAHLDQALTQTPYDGQMGWAFLDAYRVTCDERYLDVGLKLAACSEPNSSHVLNWGLLEAMNLLRAHDVTGEDAQLAEATAIVNGTLGFQNSDGSFPHQDQKGLRSLPYTSWLARDLGVFAEHDGAPAEVAAAVDRAAALLARQLSADGSPKYEGDSLVVVRIPDPVCVKCARQGSAGCANYCSEVCPGDPELLPCSCITDPQRDCPFVDALVPITYYDDGNAEYDVRGWTSELPATAAVLDKTGRLEAKWKVLGFLFRLQNSDGSFPDKWGYVPRPEDGMWLLGSEEHSVIRTSAVFYYLSGMLSPPDVAGRAQLYAASGEVAAPLESADSTATEDAAPPRDSGELRLFVSPNPSFGTVSIDYDAEATPCLVQILDVSGRLITELGSCANPGADVVWNGRDAGGRRVPPGVYFVKLTSGAETSCTKLILLGPDGAS